jgi:hypothetical protein
MMNCENLFKVDLIYRLSRHREVWFDGLDLAEEVWHGNSNFFVVERRNIFNEKF